MSTTLCAPTSVPAAGPRLDRRALLVLILLTPGIPELLTGSTTITRLVFDPFGFLVTLLLDLALYTTGALLIREAAVRWNRGWGTVLLLGLAYGIVEEGLAVHTFFQPGGNPVALFGSYGRWLGLNWVWAGEFAFFHATFSIALPLYLYTRIYPDLRGVPLLTRRSALVCVGGILSVVLLGDLAFAAVDRPPILWEVGLSLAVLLLAAAARYLPNRFALAASGPPRASARRFLLLGLLPFAAWLPGSYLLAYRGAPPTLTLLLVGASYIVPALLVLRWIGSESNDPQCFAFVVGLLLPIFAFSTLFGLVIVPGLELVDVAYIGGLWWLRRHVFTGNDGYAAQGAVVPEGATWPVRARAPTVVPPPAPLQRP
ncbi:MAG: hypothetical protein L3K04_06910 [Thermoplasmata archaeon]|nr:hypothetical protein [Thermoplasmata archaeon]